MHVEALVTIQASPLFRRPPTTTTDSIAQPAKRSGFIGSPRPGTTAIDDTVTNKEESITEAQTPTQIEAQPPLNELERSPIQPCG